MGVSKIESFSPAFWFLSVQVATLERMIRPFVWPDGEILRSTVKLQVEMSAEGKKIL